MMDIIQRLRCINKGDPVSQQAADEIYLLRAQVAALTEDLAESDAIRDKCARLLAETAVALKGPEKALHRHGWQDLPEVAAKLTTALGKALEALEYWEAYQGFCHLPASAVSTNTEALAAIDGVLNQQEISRTVTEEKGGA